MKFNILVTVFISIFSYTVHSQNIAQWRGFNRSGIYNENGLLQSWPENGPKLLWEFEGIGNGYSSPVITENNVFITGTIDSTSYLFSFSLQGKLLWKSAFGKDWTKNFPGPRSTPTVYDNLVYVCSGLGNIACFDVQSGKEKWSVDMVTDFNAIMTRFGFSESLLVDENNVYCVPGAAEKNVVALNRVTGKVTWISKGAGDTASYCAPVIIKLPGRNIFVTFTAHELIGIDLRNGEFLWSHKQEGIGDVHGNPPIFDNGNIYYVSGDGNGAVKLELSPDGSRIREIWRSKDFDNIMGGYIKVGDILYGAAHGKKGWKGLNTKTVQITDSLKFDRGSTIYADGMLYCYNEKGEVGLVKPTPTLQLISKFKISKGTKEHFAHPAINNGVLYIRHGNALMAYDIKK